jgi:ankyrin repeat protein
MQTIDPYSHLTRAARNGNANEVKALHSKGTQVDGRDYGNQTALEVAAWNGRLEVAKISLSNGANVNLVGKNGFIPLMAAVEHPDVVRALLARGAHVDAKITNGKTALR